MNLEIELKIDQNQKDPKIIIYTKEITEEISDIIKTLEAESETQKIIGTLDDKKYLMSKNDIESFYSESNKVYARTTTGNYKINYKLYELEEIFKDSTFVRISNSEIVNFDKVDYLDIKDGTIYLYFKSKQNTFVSRRFMKKIKEYLKI